LPIAATNYADHFGVNGPPWVDAVGTSKSLKVNTAVLLPLWWWAFRYFRSYLGFVTSFTGDDYLRAVDAAAARQIHSLDGFGKPRRTNTSWKFKNTVIT